MKHSGKRSNIVPTSVDPRANNALKYRSSYCERVVALARLGQFPEDWCAEIGISLSTMYNWANRYDEFDEACQLAWTCLTAHWTKRLVDTARGGPGDAKALIHIVAKRFPDTWGYTAKNTRDSFPTSPREGKRVD